MKHVEYADELAHAWKVRCAIWCLIGLVVGIAMGIWATQDQFEARYMSTIDKFYITYSEQSRQWHALFPGREEAERRLKGGTHD